MCLPIRKAAPEIAFDTCRHLIPLLRSLGQELQDNRGKHFGYLGPADARRHRQSRDVAVDPLHRFAGGEREGSHEHLVKRHAKGVEVAPRIDGAVHSPGLLGCHIGQCSGDDVRRGGQLSLPGQPGGQTEAHQPRLPRRHLHHDVGGFHVAMDQPPRMEIAEGFRQTDGQDEKFFERQRRSDQAVQKVSSGIIQNEDRKAMAFRQVVGTSCPTGIEFISQRIDVINLIHARRRWMLRIRRQEKNGGGVPGSPASGYCKLPIQAQLIEKIAG